MIIKIKTGDIVIQMMISLVFLFKKTMEGKYISE